MAKSKTKTVYKLVPRRPQSHRRQQVSRGLGIFKGGLGNVKRTLEPYATALGMGTIFVAGGSKVFPAMSMQQAQIAGVVGEYVGGGIKGAIGAELIKKLAGVPSIFDTGLSGLFGGGGGQQQMMSGGNSALL